ncbi:conserved hypothetical protein [Leishmania major strain Friedlin]|uniref:Uncharacterized protein n=1 Tax=Leishmania major TaxID=5664 RepID=E9AC80_LEIMA|nr:conserved hypothetical protein [Leishmania major strain Friedlin]CAG9567155.1 hypothetical_protein_-_conserved [Leishmania major strain Friedlin]CBZ11894.1 conserved hypothetical protein [Leishmania major strain Friedlin]|eukprot:XP_003721611.1 conserved hypothetical protein [Leishmania major strain Friedlin]
MPAPSTAAVRVPFYYTASGVNAAAEARADRASAPEDAVFITNVFIEVVAFGTRFFWVHVSESPTNQSVPQLGACSVAVGLQLSGDGGRLSISSSQLMEFEAARQQDMPTGTNSSVQSTFSTSLGQRLVRGIAKRLGAQATVYVNCAIEGERCLPLLGTDGGSGFDMTFQFGALVYEESYRLIAQRCVCACV